MNALSLQRAALQASSEEELAGRIVDEFGLYVRVADAWQLLGFRSLDAARRAAVQGRLGVEAMNLPGRRGRVVRSQSLARWLFEASRAQPQ
jgi:hypothetical protein